MRAFKVIAFSLILIGCNSRHDNANRDLVSTSSSPSAKVADHDSVGSLSDPSSSLRAQSEIFNSNGESLGKVDLPEAAPSGEMFLVNNGQIVTDKKMKAQREVGLVGGLGGVQSSLDENLADAEGVLIEFKGPSASQVAAAAKAKGASAGSAKLQALARRDQIKAEQKKIKDELSAKLKKPLVTYTKTKQNGKIRHHEFVSAVNGLALYDVSMNEAKVALDGNPSVQSISPNYKVQAVLLDAVKIVTADRASQILDVSGRPLDGTGKRIGIVDTGINYSHSDLGGCLGATCKVVGGYDFINNDSDPADDHGHGTHVAATAAGNGSYTDATGAVRPLLGIAPGAKIYGIKVLNANGSGSTAQVIKGIEFCGDPNSDFNYSDRLDVCNLSLGGSGNPDDLQSKAVDSITDIGVVFAIAGGNSGPGDKTIGSPGTSRKAITVAASCKPGDTSQYCMTAGVPNGIASFSSRGPVVWTDANGIPQTIMKPDVAAPGVSICAAQKPGYSTDKLCLDSKHIAISGTSMATPVVTGAIALMLQAHPEYRAADVKNAFKTTAVNLGKPENVQGAGQLDLVSALQFAGLPNADLKVVGAFNIFDNPQRMIQTYSVPYTITNLKSTTFTVSPSSDVAAAPGVSVSFDKTSMSLSAGASTVLTATYTIDHSIVGTGSLSGYIILNGTTTPVRVGFRIDTSPRYKVTPSSLDYIAMSPTAVLPSKTLSVAVSNNMLDLSVSYNVTVKCCTSQTNSLTSGFTMDLGGSPVVLAAGQTKTLNFTLTADNSKISQLGFFKGSVVFSSPLQTFEVPFQVFRGYSILLDFGSSARRPALIRLIRNDTVANVSVAASSPSKHTVFWTFAPPYASFAVFLNGNEATFMGSDQLVQNAEGAYVAPMDESTATNMISISDPIRPDGTRIGTAGSIMNLALRWQNLDWNAVTIFGNDSWDYKRTPPAVSLNCTDCLVPGFSFRTNNLSPKFLVQMALVPTVKSSLGGPDAYIYSLEGGISGNRTLSNSTSSFVTKDVVVPDVGFSFPPYIAARPSDEANYWYYSNGGPYVYQLQTNVPAKHFTSVVRDISESVSDVKYPAVMPYLELIKNSGSSSLVGIYVSKSAYFELSKVKPKSWVRNGYGSSGDYKQIPVLTQPQMGFNIAPGYDSRNIELKNYVGLYSEVINCSFRGSANDELLDIPLKGPQQTLIKLNGTVLASNASDSACGYYAFPAGTVNQFALDPGQYEVTVDNQDYLNGAYLQRRLHWRFLLPAAYNGTPVAPPSMLGLRLISNGTMSSFVLNDGANVLEFDLDPSGSVSDSLNNVKAEASRDNGVTWQTMPLTTVNATGFKATVPAAAGALRYTFRLSATDSMGSSLEYSFQMLGRAATDTGAPVVTIASPANGAALTGTVTISAQAVDDFGVTGMNLYLNGQLVAGSSSSSVKYVWNTTASNYPDGAYTIEARASDATGKTGTKISQVTVANYAGDTTPPTQPTNLVAVAGKIKGGGSPYVSLTWNASTDNLKLGPYRVYRNGVLLATSWSASYMDYNYPTSTALTYYVVAIDMAGNPSAPSNSVTIDGRTTGRK